MRIWFGGQTGAGQAFAAIFIACLGLAAPLYFLSHAVTLPQLTDVETTPDEPLDFKMLNTMRPADANPIVEPDEAADRAAGRGLSRYRPDVARALGAGSVQPRA